MLWIAAGLVGLISVAPGIDRALPEKTDGQETVEGHTIARAPDGQFYVNGRVGDTDVRFLVDPEAEAVLIAGPDAEWIGLRAGGGSSVMLDSLTIGPTRQRGVAAQVASAMPVSVLGRTYLSRLAATQVRGDRLILR